jgi:hypothetical protein
MRREEESAYQACLRLLLCGASGQRVDSDTRSDWRPYKKDISIRLDPGGKRRSGGICPGVEISKSKGKTRKLGISTIKDRVVQGGVKLILEPIFEVDFQVSSFAYRPQHTAHQALDLMGTRAKANLCR